MNKKRIQLQDRSLISTYFDQIKQTRQKPLRPVPRWRHPLLGYLFSVPLVSLSTGILLLESLFLPNLSSRGPVLSLAIVLVGLIWGIGPAILAVFLSTLSLDYFLLPAPNQFNLSTWKGLLQILPFMLAGLLIAIIAGQREAARRRALSAEYEKQEHASLLEAVFDSMADAVIVYDGKGDVLQANAAGKQILRLLVRPHDLNSSLHERGSHVNIRDENGHPLSEEQWPHLRILQGELLSGIDAMDVIVNTLSGQDIQLSVTGSPIRDRDGKPMGAVCIVREVTERRQLERRTQETLHRMDDFLGIASHELRTPLTSVKGSIQLAYMKLAKLLPQCSTLGSDLTKGLEFIELLLQRADRQSELLNRLINDLLDVSRIQAGKLELHLAPCDLVTIVHDIVQEQRQVASSRSIDLHLPSEPVSVFADVDRIGQVVTNYLTNALKFSGPDTLIDVSLHIEGDNVRVSVRDEGPGLSEAEQTRIWERFYQAKDTDVKYGSSVGLGIGLHICQSIITRHQGNVGVQSISDQGSTFWFTLPISSK